MPARSTAACWRRSAGSNRPRKRRVSRVLLPMAATTGDGHSSGRAGYPAARAANPEVRRGGPPHPSLFGLAPGGVYQAAVSPRRWCALTAPFHPYLSPTAFFQARAIGGVFSVALSVGLRRLPVRKHPALRCSDFPRPGHTRAATVPSALAHLRSYQTCLRKDTR